MECYDVCGFDGRNLRVEKSPPLCTWCLAKLLRDDVITFIKIEPTGKVGPLLQDAVIVQSTARNARSQGPY